MTINTIVGSLLMFSVVVGLILFYTHSVLSAVSRRKEAADALHEQAIKRYQHKLHKLVQRLKHGD